MIHCDLDGRCDDLYNYEECLYDHGDCCRPIIQGECEECICHEDGQVKTKLGKVINSYTVVPLFIFLNTPYNKHY